MKSLLVAGLLLLLQACSTAQIYEGMRENRRQHCEQYDGALYDECMQRYEDDYRRYSDKRESLESEDR